MSKVWFTADIHFTSKKHLNKWKRPFKNEDEMNQALIYTWNTTVGSDDTVFFLGDFGDYRVIKHLKGKICFLPGNHDQSFHIEEMKKYNHKIIKNNHTILIEKKWYSLVHEPYKADCKDKFYLFGHIHALQMVKRNGINVGIDCHNYNLIDSEYVSHIRNKIENIYDEDVFSEYLGK